MHLCMASISVLTGGPSAVGQVQTLGDCFYARGSCQTHNEHEGPPPLVVPKAELALVHHGHAVSTRQQYAVMRSVAARVTGRRPGRARHQARRQASHLFPRRRSNSSSKQHLPHHQLRFTGGTAQASTHVAAAPRVGRVGGRRQALKHWSAFRQQLGNPARPVTLGCRSCGHHQSLETRSLADGDTAGRRCWATG